MAETTDLESDQFMTLLTDALRAGPGSPEWHQAVGKLRTSGAKGADEMQLLIRAREDLESGREYRSVRAGAGFTRKVLTALEEEPANGSGGRGIPSANIVALVAAGVLLAVVVVVAVVLFKSGPTPPTPPNKVEQLQAQYFVTPVAAADFEAAGAATGDVGPDWRVVGEVPLKVVNKGLRAQPVQPAAGDAREYRAGVLAKAEPVPADQPAMVEATFKVAGKPTDAVIPQVFVSDAPPDDAKGTSPHELVWLLKGGQPQLVKPDMSVPATGARLEFKGGGTHTIAVKVRFNRDTVIVETGDKRLYEGPLELSPTGTRYVGVRFLRKVGDGSDGVWLSSVRLFKP